MEKICKEEKAPVPEIDTQTNYFYVTFKPNPEYLKLVSTTQKTTQKILELIKNNEKITRKELSEKIGLSEAGIKFNLNLLKKRKILKRIGPDKGGYWKVMKQKEDGK